MIPADQTALVTRAQEEAAAAKACAFTIPVVLDLPTALMLVSQLQLAARHPGNVGPALESNKTIVRGVIDRTRIAGFEAFAAMMELGNNPANDYEPEPPGAPSSPAGPSRATAASSDTRRSATTYPMRKPPSSETYPLAVAAGKSLQH